MGDCVHLQKIQPSSDSALHSYSTTNKMHLLFPIIYSCKTLYMFRTAIRPSSGAQNCVYSNGIVKHLLLPAAIAAAVCCCCISSFELLMMGEKTEICRAFYKNK